MRSISTLRNSNIEGLEGVLSATDAPAFRHQFNFLGRYTEGWLEGHGLDGRI